PTCTTFPPKSLTELLTTAPRTLQTLREFTLTYCPSQETTYPESAPPPEPSTTGDSTLTGTSPRSCSLLTRYFQTSRSRRLASRPKLLRHTSSSGQHFLASGSPSL